MKTPSYAVLDGIIEATSLYLAGPPDSGLENDPEHDEKQEKAERKIAGLPSLPRGATCAMMPKAGWSKYWRSLSLMRRICASV